MPWSSVPSSQGLLTERGVAGEVGDSGSVAQLPLVNAVKYNEAGGKVTLALCRSGTEAKLSHSHAVEGSGLGLSIAQWIARANGGSIQVASGDRGLTTVTVILPLAEG